MYDTSMGFYPFEPKTLSGFNRKRYFSQNPTKKKPEIDPFRSTYFVSEKDKGDEYFRTTRVNSCRKIVIRNGVPFALTFKIRNPKGEPMCHFNYTFKDYPTGNSTYHDSYCLKKQQCHLSMKKKPLVPYNPLHPRNMLLDRTSFSAFRTMSDFYIGDSRLLNRKQWMTTYKDSFRSYPIKRISNPGIISDQTKRIRHKLNSIDYC